MSKQEHPKLNQYFATAICGNDILSSALYVSGIAIIFAGVYAPLVLLLIVLILYFYKAVYTEVVEALPINGGAYNCLLNGTSKTIAAFAGVTTILSYVATAVISAKVGVEYLLRPLKEIFNYNAEFLVIPFTILLLLAFALLVISGLKDSAKVAFGIFIFHILILSVFVIIGVIFLIQGHSEFNFNVAKTTDILQENGGLVKTIFFAFAASLLGVSGFESSANFVEEQDKGVFRKTLRNMLIGVGIFNPLIALVVLNSMPFDAIKSASDFLLADAAHIIGGTYFELIVVADAFLVLSGAVLTAYIGVSGLIHRMAGDSCLPNSLTKENAKGSFPRIIVSFFILCSSILVVTKGDLLSLAGVYTIAFLGVMTLFALGNLILKESRTELKRTYHAPRPLVVLAALGTFIGIVGNIQSNPQNLTFFSIYFIPAILIVLSMIYLDAILSFFIKATQGTKNRLNTFLIKNFSDVIAGRFIVFIHNTHRLYEILDYINTNETGHDITLIYCKDGSGSNGYEEIKEALPYLKKAGVFTHLNITIAYKDKFFDPEIIDEVSKEFKVRKNRILIGSIHHHHKFDYSDLGGVRIIF